LHHDNPQLHTFFFTREFLTKKQHDCRPPTAVLFSVFPVQDGRKGRHFDTVEVTEAESQAVLNTFTEHDFQDAFQKWQKRWERRVPAEGDYYLRPVGPKLVSDQMAAHVPEIMDGSM
jgi:hypothetical protein